MRGVEYLKALLASWVVLRLATRIKKLVGDNVIDVVSRVMGLLLVALVVTFIKKAWRARFPQASQC